LGNQQVTQAIRHLDHREVGERVSTIEEGVVSSR
jgi:hypothetical protein